MLHPNSKKKKKKKTTAGGGKERGQHVDGGRKVVADTKTKGDKVPRGEDTRLRLNPCKGGKNHHCGLPGGVRKRGSEKKKDLQNRRGKKGDEPTKKGEDR